MKFYPKIGRLEIEYPKYLEPMWSEPEILVLNLGRHPRRHPQIPIRLDPIRLRVIIWKIMGA